VGQKKHGGLELHAITNGRELSLGDKEWTGYLQKDPEKQEKDGKLHNGI